MFKTQICMHYKNNSCFYMENPSKCKYAHGTDDIFIPSCWYDTNCLFVDCKFRHSNINGRNGIRDKEYDLKDFINNNNNIVKKNKKNKNNLFDKINIHGKKEFFGTNNKCYNTNIVETSEKNDIDIIKTLEHVDIYYLDIINNLKNKCNILHDKNKKLMNIINKDTEYTSSAMNTEPLKNIDIPINENKHKRSVAIQTDLAEDDIINKNVNKKLIKYEKWINVYNILSKYEFNYKNIDLNEI